MGVGGSCRLQHVEGIKPRFFHGQNCPSLPFGVNDVNVRALLLRRYLKHPHHSEDFGRGCNDYATEVGVRQYGRQLSQRLDDLRRDVERCDLRQIDHSGGWVSANGVLSPIPKEFLKHFVGDPTAEAATKNPISQTEIERIGQATSVGAYLLIVKRREYLGDFLYFRAKGPCPDSRPSRS